LILGALRELGEVLLVLRLVLEELVHVLDRLDAETASRLREIEVVELLAKEGAVKRPLGKRDLVEAIARLLLGLLVLARGVSAQRGGPQGKPGGEPGGTSQELS